VRESSTAAGGGLDLTGLDWLEFDLGHTGSAPITVQFYTQAAAGTGPSPNYSFSGLGPDLAIAPGMATYRVPLTALPADQLVYIRQFGVQTRAHEAVGNVTWTLREVRSGGEPLSVRDLITHDTGSPEGGLQGAIVNFDNAAVLGNGGQNQTGLSHNPAGSGSLRWTDVGGGPGAAITWGNGTPWAGNGFNHWTTDLGGYTEMIVRMSATGTPGAGETTVGVQGFFQKDGFGSFQAADGGASKPLPIDGQFHELNYSLEGLTSMNVVNHTGLNLGSHQTNLEINVDNIRFRRLESETLFSWESGFEGWVQGPDTGHVHSLVSTGATHGTTALQIDRTSVPGTGSTPADDNFVVGSSFTTTNAAQIGSLVDSINNAEKVAFDITYSDFFPPADYTNFFIIFRDDTGAIYQAQTPGIDLGGAENEKASLVVALSDFDDVIAGSTKNLAVDGLSETTTTLSIAIASSTNSGAIYQIDNFRVLSLGETAEPIAGDFNNDQQVDGEDLATWRSSFGPGAGADADADGDSDGNDFLIWQRQLGAGAPQVAAVGAVPEPAAWMLGLIALALPAWRRR
jgi:hypothetical protein